MFKENRLTFLDKETSREAIKGASATSSTTDFSQEMSENLQDIKESPLNRINAKTIQGYIEKTNSGLTPDEVREGLIDEVIKGKSVKDIRFGLLGESKKADSVEQKAKTIKTDTVWRIMAYTDYEGTGLVGNHWFTLDYQKVDETLATGTRHEMGIGLGDILLDPRIKEVVVIRNGIPINGHREVIKSPRKHRGRIGFADENGEYIATRTDDKFMIVESDGDSMPNEKITQEFNQEETTRQKEAKHYTERNSLRINIERTRFYSMISEELEATKEENPEASESETRELTLEKIEADIEAEESKTEPDRSEKRIKQLKKMAKELKSALEIMQKHPEFDLSKFKNAIASVESRKASYKARNDITAKRLNAKPDRKKKITSDKWAFGKYQFLAPTANWLGGNLVPTNEDSIQKFLKDEPQQEILMTNLTLHNIKIYDKFALKHPDRITKLNDDGVGIYQILALIHFGGGNCGNWQSSNINMGSSDWMNGSIGAYLKRFNETLNQ